MLLRTHRADDLDDLGRYHSDPEVVRHLPWPVRDEEQVRAALAIRIARTSAARAGDWLVAAAELRGADRVIGEFVLKHEDDGRVAELGYALARDQWRRGLAHEGSVAMMELARGFGVTRFTAVVERGNESSVRLLERLGFTPDDDAAPGGLLRFARDA